MPIINSVIKGKQPVIDTLNVTPTTSAQQITATGGTDGYSPVNVSAVTSSIDANIQAGNIKKDVTILGVTGSFEGGVTPTGTKSITSNGVYDVTNFASADVQVPTTAPAYYIEKTKDANNKLLNGSTLINLSGVTELSSHVLEYAYNNNTNITGAVDFSSVTTISGSFSCRNMCENCTGITSVDLSSLTTISGSFSCSSMFNGCSGITSINLSSLTTISSSSNCANMFINCSGITGVVDLSSLTTISGISLCQSMFSRCTGITGVNLSSLTTISNGYSNCSSMFNGCSGITSIDLSSLATISGSNDCQSMFNGCSNLSRVSFYALDTNSFGSSTSQFNKMLNGVTGCTVHFPMRIQSTIGSWSDVTAGFNGTNTTVLFDIVTTLTGADSNSYVRTQKNSTSTATAWTYNNTLYYTSGTTEPSVGDTIYSDAACTTTVTTVSSIS